MIWLGEISMLCPILKAAGRSKARATPRQQLELVRRKRLWLLRGRLPKINIPNV